jgi:tetratricopeptide (TPR) repeat protein
MSNTKVCPACHKELPVLAVRCKFCGFRQPATKHADKGDLADTAIHSIIQNPKKQPPNHSDGNEKESPKPQNIVGNRRPRKETLKINASKLASALRQHKGGTMVASDADNPSGKKGLSTATMKSRQRRASRPPLKSPTEKKVIPATPRKKTAMGMGPVKMPTRTVRVEPASAAPAPATSPAGESRNKGDGDVSLIMSLDDDSSLVLLDSDESQALELDLGDVDLGDMDADQLTTELAATEIPEVPIHDTPSEPVESVSGKTPAAQWIARIQRQVAAGFAAAYQRTVEIIRPLATKLTPMIGRIPPKMRIVIVGAPMILLIGIAVTVGLVSSQHRKEDALPTDTAAAQPSPPDGRHADVAQQPATPSATEALNERNQCLPLSKYADFPGQSELTSVVTRLGGEGLCALMGVSLSGIQKGIPSDVRSIDSAYDGIPESTSLILPSTDAEGNVIFTIELAFADNRLFRIELNYGAKSDPHPDIHAMARTLNAETDRRDVGENSITEVRDKDLVVEWLVPSAAGGPRLLMITDAHSEVVSREQLDALERARSLVTKGMLLLEKQKNANALDAFQSALEINGHLGNAWIGRANAQLRLEDFTGARTAAENAMKVTDDGRIHSRAEQVFAVIALRNDERKGAVSHLNAAVKADRINTDAITALSELKTGEYQTLRVAMTAARMSCSRHLNASVQGLLARGNFPDVQTFFNALEMAKHDVNFEPLKRKAVSRECR